MQELRNFRSPPERSLSDLPAVDEGGFGSLSLPWSRRQFVRRTFAGAVALSLASLGVLPPARRAYADHEGSSGYQIKSSCGYGYDYGCLGCGDSHVCGLESDGPCCVPPGNHREHWHKDEGFGGGNYRIRHNKCIPGNDYFDGWKWDFSQTCGVCRGGRLRCHDGWRLDDNGNRAEETICRATVQCNFN